MGERGNTLLGINPRLRRALGNVEVADDFASGDGGSYQTAAIDLTLAAAAGSSEDGDTAYLAPVMANVLGGALTGTENYIGGVIAAFSATSTASTYPTGAVLAQITDGVSDTGVHGVIAFIDGDSETTIAGAAFKVMCNNSTVASGFHYGLDLYDAAHDGFAAVDPSFYLTADMRLAGQNIVKSGTGAPAFAAPAGSVFIRTDGANANEVIYVNFAGNSTWTPLTG